MSNLPDELRDTCCVVTELEHARAFGAKALRAQVDLMTTASRSLRARPDVDHERRALEALAREVREEAIELRRRHRIVRHSVLTMMD